MRTLGLPFLLCATAFALPFAASAQSGEYYREHYQDQVVRCESHDGRPRQCAVDTRGGVRLVRQLSRSECVEGRSWGRVRDGIWVSNGCRGEFLVGFGGRDDRYGRGDGYGDSGGFVRCESNDGRSNYCAADTRRGVELVRQLSRSACIQGQSWGWDNRGVWVSGGCRAEFRTRGGRWARGDGYSQPPQIVRCESADGRSQRCAIDTRGGVRLVRQLSRSACIEGHSWGVERRGIWVDDGCRAEFEVGGRDGREWWGRR